MTDHFLLQISFCCGFVLWHPPALALPTHSRTDSFCSPKSLSSTDLYEDHTISLFPLHSWDPLWGWTPLASLALKLNTLPYHKASKSLQRGGQLIHHQEMFGPVWRYHRMLYQSRGTQPVLASSRQLPEKQINNLWWPGYSPEKILQSS